MRTAITRSLFKRLALLAAASILTTHALGAPPTTEFTYQGALMESGTLVDEATPMEFKLWDAPSGGNQVGPTLNHEVAVDEGVFSQSLDFGVDAFTNNQALWLEIIVDGQSTGRAPLGAAPFALNTRGISVDEHDVVRIGDPDDINRYFLILDGRISIGSHERSNARLQMLSESGVWWLGTDANGGPDANANQFYIRGETVPHNSITIQQDTGRVALGHSDPAAILDVGGRVIFRTGGARGLTLAGGSPSNAPSEVYFDKTLAGNEHQAATGYAPDRGAFFWVNGADRLNISTNGNVGIGTTSPATKLDVNGAITIRGGADLVEGFDSVCDNAHEPGTVLVIDPNNPGKLMCASDPYDKKVAGVVSGANGIQPGIRLGQDGIMDGDIPVAMTGRVYVKATNENGPIQPGDRLTTASLPGHAMKATDNGRADGAVIGKAMTALDEPTGMVLVLVNLQ